MAQITEVLRAHGKTQDLFNHGREVGQRTNGSQRWSIAGACQTPRGSQSKGVRHRLEGHAALVQLGREAAVRPADGAARARSGTGGIEKLPDIVALLLE